MYQQGEMVVYGIHGVCRVTGQETRMVDRKTVMYLVLEPVGQEGTRYLVPSHNAAAMGKLSPMLKPEELDALICSDAVRCSSWIGDENVRKQTYRELISSGDRVGLMRMIHALYRHGNAQKKAGKKFHMADENFLRDAERLLAGEISMIKGISQEEAKIIIRTKLNEE